MITNLTQPWLGFATVALIGFLARPATPGGSNENGTTGPQSQPELLEKLVEGGARIPVFGPVTVAGALTADEKRLCVVMNIISSNDLRAGLSLVDLEAKRRVDQITFSEPGYPWLAAAATHEGISRCYMSISRQSGQLDSEGRNRIEVVRLDEDNLVVEEPILTPEICTSRLARKIHKFSAAAPPSSTLAAFPLLGLLDRVTTMPAGPSEVKPCQRGACGPSLRKLMNLPG